MAAGVGGAMAGVMARVVVKVVAAAWSQPSTPAGRMCRCCRRPLVVVAGFLKRPRFHSPRTAVPRPAVVVPPGALHHAGAKGPLGHVRVGMGTLAIIAPAGPPQVSIHRLLLLRPPLHVKSILPPCCLKKARMGLAPPVLREVGHGMRGAISVSEHTWRGHDWP